MPEKGRLGKGERGQSPAFLYDKGSMLRIGQKEAPRGLFKIKDRAKATGNGRAKQQILFLIEGANGENTETKINRQLMGQQEKREGKRAGG